MADPTPEELDLRRRARRRLIGAIAIAVFAVVVLPMIFDPEPKPLGNDVEIRIPDMTEPLPAPAAPAAEAPPAAAAPAAMPAQAAPDAPAEPAPRLEPAANPPAQAEKPAVPVASAPKAVAEKPAETKPMPARPAEAKPAEAKKPEPEAKKPEPAPSAGGHYLQLGVFGSEANARQLAEKAAQAGFKAQVIRDGAQYRVRLGPYAEREQALDVQARLKAKDFTAVVVKP